MTSTKLNVRIHSKIYLNEVFYDLKSYRNEWFEKFKEENPKKTEPKSLPELVVAKGLNKYTHVITLENGKVALYDPERGYYQKDYRYAYQLIYILEPTFNETKCRNVLFLLSNMSRKYEYNRMRMDFEPEYQKGQDQARQVRDYFEKHGLTFDQ